MSNKTSRTDKTAVLCVVTVLAAMTLSCSPRQSLRGKDSQPNVAASPAASPIDWAGIDERIRARRQAFADRKEELTKPPAKGQLTKEPYIKGKAAFYHYDVSPEEPKADGVLDNYLEGQRTFGIKYEKAILEANAKTPEEVETVVLQKCQPERSSLWNYGNSNRRLPLYLWNCELTIVDRTIPAVIYRKKFEGGLPTGPTVKEDKVISDSLPRKEMYAFLAGLPHK